MTESLTIKFNNSIGPKLKEKSGNMNFLATSPSTNFVLNTRPTFETLWNFLQWFKGSLHWQSVNFYIYSTSIVRVWLTDKQVKNTIPLQLIAWGYIIKKVQQLINPAKAYIELWLGTLIWVLNNKWLQYTDNLYHLETNLCEKWEKHEVRIVKN